MTIEYDRGDIFAVALRENRDLMIVFGHIGFNEMALAWRNFQNAIGAFRGIIDPFVELHGQWKQYRPDKWAVFVKPTKNHGMSDQEIREVLHSVLSWGSRRKLRTVVTNGVQNADHGLHTMANRESDARRAHLIDQVVREYESRFDSIKLISLNDVFARYLV